MLLRDWLLTAATLLFVGGLHLDGWAHLHLPGLETFFTPWHAVLYAGFGATALVVAVDAWRSGAAPHTWRRLDPDRRPAVAGVFIFGAGGAIDLAWHTFLGIEVSTEALVSPPHLLLATGLVLMVSGPFRRALKEGLPQGVQALPALVSASLTLSVLTFFTQIFHPYGRPWMASGNRPVDADWALMDPSPPFPGATGTVPSADIAQIAGVASVLLQTLFLMAVVLLLVRRGPVPFGGLTIVFLLNGALMGLMRGQPFAIGVALLAGVGADVLASGLRPSPERRSTFYAFAGLVPLLLYTIYVAAVHYALGTWWSVHLLTGVPVVAALVGLALAAALLAPERRTATL